MLVIMKTIELKQAHDRADGVYRSKLELGIKSNVYHDDKWKVGRAAFAAEAAFQKVFPQAIATPPPDDPKDGDGGIDFTFPRSRLTADVKSRTTDDRKLILPRRHYPPRADIYVLTLVNEATVSLVGWCWGDDIVANAIYVKGEEAGPYWCLGKEELRIISTLFKVVR